MTEDANYDVIYLSPRCAECAGMSHHEQEWCTEPQSPCEECGLKWTRYARQSEER